MKRIVLAFIASGIAMCVFGQEDSTAKKSEADTIKIGGMIIIKDGKESNDDDRNRSINISRSSRSKRGNLSTNWWIVDLGFANYEDNTNYGSAATQAFAPGFSGKDQLKLRNGKSVNVNIWMFMQRLNVIKHVVNLKYGLGVELNNYHFDDRTVRFQKNPTQITLDPAWADYKKNKLAADYVTVPAMLNFNFTPRKDKGFGFSAGVSAGYLYSARQKVKYNDEKDKFKDDFDLQRFKYSYIGELSLGIVRFYGSYSPKSMWEKGLDQKPFNVGVRFSNW